MVTSWAVRRGAQPLAPAPSTRGGRKVQLSVGLGAFQGASVPKPFPPSRGHLSINSGVVGKMLLSSSKSQGFGVSARSCGQSPDTRILSTALVVPTGQRPAPRLQHIAGSVRHQELTSAPGACEFLVSAKQTKIPAHVEFIFLGKMQ